MFDALKNMGGLLQAARQAQEQMKGMQEELGNKLVSGDAGNGLVTATVNGRLELQRIKIDKSKLDVNDLEMLEDVIVAAVRTAQGNAAEMAKQEMEKKAAEMGLPPGLLGK